MSNEQLLEIGLADTFWADDVKRVIHGNEGLNEVAGEAAQRLRACVLEGRLSVDDLRQGVAWASSFDQEAVERYGSDLRQGEQRAERTARRLIHAATRGALESVRSRVRRTVGLASLQASVSRLSMGRQETHDMGT